MVLIAGGSDRDQDYDAARRGARRRGAPTTLILLPDTGARRSLRRRRPTASLKTACRQRETCGRQRSWPGALAQHGGVVLLSPAAPSFNQYANFEERGDDFAARSCRSLARVTNQTATYLADPEDVHRVLLLYSGGLDTSVMLKWIQDQYDAEVVALTVNLGQPGEDYDVVKGKALQLGAVDAFVVDAREEFARDYIAPAIKANAIYGLGYPLFTALGRPLIAKLAVEYARKSGCDTIAHGCTGKGNDQVRIEATVATLAPELKVIAPVR